MIVNYKLYENIKTGSHVICLEAEQTKTYLFLAWVKSRAHELHSSYRKFGKQSVILIFEPNNTCAKERYKLLSNHTELKLINLFETTSNIEQYHQVILCSLNNSSTISNSYNLNINSIIFDYADQILELHNPNDIASVVFESANTLVLNCSLIENQDHEVNPSETAELIRKLEYIFKAKCETSSDLRSISRQFCTPSNFIIQSDFNLIPSFQKQANNLLDELISNYCKFICDRRLELCDDNLLNTAYQSKSKYPPLSSQKQLLLVKSCLTDVIHSTHSLGLWCAKKTTQLYLNELTRILHLCPNNDIIASAVTVLNLVYKKFEQLLDWYMTNKEDQINLFNEHIPQLCQISAQSHALLSLLIQQERCKSYVIHVQRPVVAKVIALWFEKLSSKVEKLQFIKANYIVGSARKYRNKSTLDNFDLHHETAIREFRYGNNNLFVSATSNQKGIDIPRSHMVISFDVPTSFHEYIYSKASCRSEQSKYFIITVPGLEKTQIKTIDNFAKLEKLIGNIDQDIGYEITPLQEAKIFEELEKEYPPYPSTSRNPATLARCLGFVNKYCTKLPSDSFTKLSPEWTYKKCDQTGLYWCEARLPINSPVKQTIIGPKTKYQFAAQRLAAYTVCKVLHKFGEIDENMSPHTKESMKHLSSYLSRESTEKDRLLNSTCSRKNVHGRKSLGTTRYRQYYDKRIAKVFSGPLPDIDIKLYLYKFRMDLICPIPDEQNRRGRRIVDPKETNRNYAIVCSQKLSKISPFPLFTRSGEVRIHVQLVQSNFTLNQTQVDNLKKFHEFTFSKVLRLEKYPIKYRPEQSPFAVLLAPVFEDSSTTYIDWDFVQKIVNSDKNASIPTIEERKNFKFKYEDYADAVVIPWYRITDCQEFAYYVAQICTELSPKSDFPDEDAGYPTFIDYYTSKYNLEVFHHDQPILDVDHTSARLNLLTPRYVNRKGITLPSSTAKTRKESRESLAQKQLLIPELCSIHPFPASFWRKAVCLPCIFHRLNSLFLAEELRRSVAEKTGVGFIEPPDDYDWEPLDFGWSSKGLKKQETDLRIKEDERRKQRLKFEAISKSSKQEPAAIKKEEQEQEVKPKFVKFSDVDNAMKQGNNASGQDFVIDHFDPSKLFIPDVALNNQDDLGWMNIKLISSSTDKELHDSMMKGWNQPIVQQDLLIEELDEVNWSDCEMNFEGEISEKVGRCKLVGKKKIVSKETKVEESSNQSITIGELRKDSQEPLIRELYVPSHRITRKQGAITNLTKSLKHFKIPNNIEVVKSEDEIHVVSNEKVEWYESVTKIEESIRRVLHAKPDLFEDVAIELDEKQASTNNPTFGELLPDHDLRTSEIQLESEMWKNIKFDPTMRELNTIGPSPSIILHALTMSNASDGINLERLETVGDSFLKYSITAYLYCMHPNLHEGKLSYLRSMEISNKNLYDLGRSKNLGDLMSATKFEPNDNWLAPGYYVERVQALKDGTNSDCNKKREIDKALAEVPYDLLLQHSIPDKSIADCVEALIGAYLTASGSRAALLFMQWLGLKVIPSSLEKSVFEVTTNKNPDDLWRWLEIPPSPLILAQPIGCDPDTIIIDPTTLKQQAFEELNRHYFGGQLDEFEKLICYTFKDKAYLVQAFSHNSFFENHVTNCHQRLEFLGDALLDYLITRYLFQDPRCHSPGTLTDLRSALVNNTFFASLAVKYNFHKYLKYISDDLFYVINGFVRKFQSDSEMTTKGYTLLIAEGESEYAEDIEVPKALGDVFESVAGAIYLDSGMSLDTVWQVYFRMMKPEIEYFSSNVPKSPIRELLESMPQNVRFSPSELAPDRKHRVVAEVFGLGRFIGVGRNKHSAKCTAAKRALRALKSRLGNEGDNKESCKSQREGSEMSEQRESDSEESESIDENEEEEDDEDDFYDSD